MPITSIKVGPDIIYIGDIFTSSPASEANGICPVGIEVVVKEIRSENLIGLVSAIPLSGWGNLDGTVKENTGLWASRDTIHDNFFLAQRTSFVIENNIKYKNQDLKGESCRILKKFRLPGCKPFMFIELDKHISAGSADGLGKMGHCLLLSEKDVILQSKQNYNVLDIKDG